MEVEKPENAVIVSQRPKGRQGPHTYRYSVQPGALKPSSRPRKATIRAVAQFRGLPPVSTGMYRQQSSVPRIRLGLTRTRGQWAVCSITFSSPRAAQRWQYQIQQSRSRQADHPEGVHRQQAQERHPGAKLMLTTEQKRERRRVRAAGERQRRKELGLCRDCPNVATEGQTPCPDCAEQHRQSREPRRLAAIT